MSTEETIRKIQELVKDIQLPERECDHIKIQEGKAIAHYEVLLSTFIESRNELDKQMLTISVATLGVLISIANRPEEINILIKGAIVISSILLLINIIILLYLNSLNSDYAAQEIEQNEIEVAHLNAKMIKWDFVAKILFAFGLTATTFTLLVQLTIK